MTSDDVKSVIMLAAVGLGAYAAWRAWSTAKGLADSVTGAAGDAIGAVSDAVSSAAGAAWEVARTDINPASTENLIYRGINGAGGYIAGEQDWSLGGWIYDQTH